MEKELSRVMVLRGYGFAIWGVGCCVSGEGVAVGVGFQACLIRKKLGK